MLKATTLSLDPDIDRELFSQWTKILYEFCNFQYIDDPSYLGSLLKIAKILSVYHTQRNPNKSFYIQSLNSTISLNQILDIIRILNDNEGYYEQIMND